MSLFFILAVVAVFNALLLVVALAFTTLHNIRQATIWRIVVWSSIASLVFAIYAIVVSRSRP